MSVPQSFISADNIRIRNLDPTIITDENKLIIESLFSEKHVNEFMDLDQHTLVVWDAVNKKNINYHVKFKYPLIIRRDFYGRIVVDVVGGAIGEGGFGFAKVIIGTLKHRLGKLQFEKETNWRVVKTGNRHHVKFDREYIDSAANEFDYTAACAHTNTRGLFTTRPVFNNDILEYAFSMRMFYGRQLYDVLQADITESQPLSIHDRFKLSLMMLEQLEAQVHMHGVVHRDIKPENIIVVKIGHRWEVNYIDFNLSRWSFDNDKKIVGTKCYLSPDVLISDLDEKSDLYSLVLIIALLWHDSEQLRIESIDDPLRERKKTNWKINLDLFNDLYEMPQEIKDKLRAWMMKCLSFDKKDRPTLYEAINEFAAIYLQYKLLEIPQQFHAGVQAAHEVGYIAKYDICTIGAKGINPSTALTLKNILLQHIYSIPDNKYAVQEFSERSGITAFANCKSQKMLEDKVNKSIKVFTDEFLCLQQQQSKLREMYTGIVSKKNITRDEADCANILLEQILYAEKIPDKLAKKPLNLDELIDQASRMIFRNQKITRAIHSVNKLLQTIEVENDSTVRYSCKSIFR